MLLIKDQLKTSKNFETSVAVIKTNVKKWLTQQQ